MSERARQPGQSKPISRRRWLKRTGTSLVAAAAGIGLYTWRIEPHWVEVVERELPIRALPSGLVGAKLVQLSDLHIGYRVDSDYLIRCLQRANMLGPDLVVITGDWVQWGTAADFTGAVRVLRHLHLPSLGCFGVLGNHDYGHGWNDPAVAAGLLKRVSDLGMRVLRNEMATVNGLQLVGADDLWGPNYAAEAVLRRIDPRQPSLALCHNPDAQDLPEWQNFQGWVLAGHTHGGQCKPPFLPPPLLPVKNKRYSAGELDLGNDRRMYINRGLGHLTRVRCNVRPEITLFRLRSV